MSEAARSHRVEPYMELPGGKRSDASGPLTELAQIVGQDDPFRAMFRPSKASTRVAAEPVAADVMSMDAYGDVLAGHETEEATYADAADRVADTETLGLRPSQHDEPHWAPAEEQDEQWQDGYDHAEPAPSSHEGYYGERPAYEAEEMPIDAPHYVAPPLTPDLWAEPEAEAAPGLSNETAVDAKASRRPLVVLMAVLALTGGGLAATFLSRSGSGAIASSAGASTAPTILAASGPTKIKQDTASDTTPEDADAALLSKNGASSGGPVRVVNSQEQPIDLGQLPKSADSQAEGSSNGSSPFPQPKKVKTFLVRPDGTLVNSTNPGAAQGLGRSLVPQLAIGGTDAAPPPAAMSRPSTPKTGGHAATTPKAPPSSIAELTGANGADTVKAQQSASPGAKSGSGLKPVEVADASGVDATATTNSGGNFALQLAASPSEQDARSAFTKLQKKYSELGSFQPTVKKVDNGQKTIYRLRVGNLGQDQAKTLCSQLQASGGSCFVVHN